MRRTGGTREPTMKTGGGTVLIKALIFDMDGLLVETESIHIRTFEEFLRRKGIVPPEGYTEGLVGYSIAENIEAIKRDLGLKGDSGELGRERNDLYLEILKGSEIVPLAGVEELLGFAEAQGLKKAVCSSSERRQLEIVLPRLLAATGRATGPEEFFDAIVYGDGRRRAKPEPDLYVACADALRMEAGACLAFEDSVVGAQAAAAAGMAVVAVPNPFSKGQREWPAACVVSSLAQVLEKGLLRGAGRGRAVFVTGGDARATKNGGI